MSDIARHLRVLGIAVAIVAIDLILVRLAGPDTKPFHWTNFAGVYNNPAPTTTGITPISATAGTIGFSLTINGSNFVSNSIVYWNRTALATSYVSDTQAHCDRSPSEYCQGGYNDNHRIQPCSRRRHFQPTRFYDPQPDPHHQQPQPPHSLSPGRAASR